MGVYIKGMEMPTSCYDCNCFIRDSDGSDYCCLLMQDIADNGKRDDDCPLVTVPKHGRLIDADALMKEFEKAENTMAKHGREYACSFMSSGQEISTEWYCVENMLDDAPTIIEVEGEE